MEKYGESAYVADARQRMDSLKSEMIGVERMIEPGLVKEK